VAMQLALNPDARLMVRYAQHDLGQQLSPFILDVSRQLAITRSLSSSVAAAAASRPDLAAFFVIDDRVGESFSLRPEHLYGDWTATALDILCEGARNRIDLVDCDSDLPDLHNLLAIGASGRYDAATIRGAGGPDLIDLASALLDQRVFVPRQPSLDRFAPPDLPGVYRLQHASLLYRSLTTGILVDPHLHSTYGHKVDDDVRRADIEGKVDAILISHFHEDHWFLSSLLMFPRDTPIVVPKVPRSTVICGDMARMLARHGFTNVVAVDWYADPLTFGDVQVEVLPFYGEQPLRFDEPKDAAIRNWGNTYVVRSDFFTSWFLIDSGSDSRGSMIDVARVVKQRHGAIDFVLSNLRPFYIATPLYINSGLNWLTLSPPQIAAFDMMGGHCITLGPAGVADVCEIVRPGSYLPYAHWFGNLGCVGDVGADTPGQSEVKLLNALAGELHRRGVDTEIVPWRIGDGFTRRPGGGFERRAVSA
jgi:L-ascorbate metabolism protein UlaG (beta-lactamase superfamily)